jgi:chemotaxis protein methyltransferase CheR
MKVSAPELEAISGLVEDLCGIVLDQTKGYLIESRLGEMVRDSNCADYHELVRRVRMGDDKWVRSNLIDAITTNETLFFRDFSPFEALRHKVIPETLDAKAASSQPNRLRIWSAACSTGQEPYSVAMLLHQLLDGFEDWDVQIIATDISDAALTQASAGLYGDFEIRRGLEPPEINRYFTAEGDMWRIKPEIRRVVRFERLNLLEPFQDRGQFDVIFCRNVAIYFRPEARESLYLRLVDQLMQGGYLFTSSSESLLDIDPRFKPEHHCRSVFYRPNGRH